ncbi:MAG TPA: hypothetical protein VFQ53_06215 [Kofleriaceae bacterium]|nr:hypothetical protein [Kofleriaceae bacterium]
MLAVPLALSSTATAQPVTAPARCEVTIVHAPDAVRNAIESWVRAEPRCATTLELRVVPTEGGLYLIAKDPSGRLRERVVPDAQSAGVLVASWVADDGIVPGASGAPPSTSAPTAAATTPSIGASTTASTTPPLAPPGETPATADATIAAPAPAPARWLGLGLMAGVAGTNVDGARLEVDIRPRRKWSLGAVAALSHAIVPILDGTNSALETRDLRLLATVTRTLSRGAWSARLTAGLGVLRTDGRLMPTEPMTGGSMGAIGEASILLGRTLGARWAITAGPVLAWYAQQEQIGPEGTLLYREAELTLLGGVRYRL